MARPRTILKRAALCLMLISMVSCPLTIAVSGMPHYSRPALQATIDFEPDVVPLETEPPPDELLPGELVLPEAFVEGNVLVINGKPFPIGDAFYDAEGIPLGTKKTDHTGLYGYALIENMPGYVLIWYLDGTGRKRYMVTAADDPLLSGPLGFDQTIEDLAEAEKDLMTAAGRGAVALTTAAVIQLAVCPHTKGLTCASGVITLAIAAIGATLTSAFLMITDLVPAMNNVESAFSTIDQKSP